VAEGCNVDARESCQSGAPACVSMRFLEVTEKKRRSPCF